MAALSAIIVLSFALGANSRRLTSEGPSIEETGHSFIEENLKTTLDCCTGNNCYGKSCCGGHRRYTNGFGTVKCIPRKAKSEDSSEESAEGSFIDEGAEAESACCTGNNCYGKSCCGGHRRYNNGFGTVKCIPRKAKSEDSTEGSTEESAEGSFIDEGTEAESACCTGNNCYGKSCCGGHRRYTNGFGTVKCIPRKAKTEDSTEDSTEGSTEGSTQDSTEDSTEVSFIDEGAGTESACCTGNNCYGKSCCGGHRRYNNGFGTVKCIPRKAKTEDSSEGSLVDDMSEE